MKRLVKRIAAMLEPHFAEAWRRHPEDHRAAYISAWSRFLGSAASMKLNDLCDDSGLPNAVYRAIRREVLAAFGLATIKQTMGEAARLPRRRRRRSRKPLAQPPMPPDPEMMRGINSEHIVALVSIMHSTSDDGSMIDQFCHATCTKREDVVALLAAHCHAPGMVQ